MGGNNGTLELLRTMRWQSKGKDFPTEMETTEGQPASRQVLCRARLPQQLWGETVTPSQEVWGTERQTQHRESPLCTTYHTLWLMGKEASDVYHGLKSRSNPSNTIY